MRRFAVPAVTAALAAAALVTSLAAASPAPYVRSAVGTKGHIVVTFTLGDLGPGRIVVATRPATTASGKFVAANIRLNERLRAARTVTGYRARTRHALRRGRYYVEVSGIVLGLDCTPAKPCPQDWSNVRRVRIPRS
jgi:hypothetical protein